MLKILIECPQGSGKTTAADIIAEALAKAGYLVENRNGEGGSETLSVCNAMEDPWASAIVTWLKGREVSDEGVSLRGAIREAICLEIVTRGDEKRVITILRGLGYEPMDRNENGKRVRRYVRPGARGETPADSDVRTLLGQRLCEHLHALLDTLEMEMPGLVRMYLDGKK